jgi:hypothetical protein
VARPVLAVVVAVAAGLLLGVGGQHASRVHDGLRWGEALGAPWLVLAFAVGAVVRVRVVAVAAGAVALVIGTGAYYLLHLRHGSPLGYVVPVALAWAVAAAAAGGLFAACGAAWRAGGAAWAAVPAGALVGEAVLLLGGWGGRAAAFVLGAELAAGLLPPFVLVRRLARVPLVLGVTVLAALVLGVAEGEVRDALRSVGWAGS